MTRSVYIHIPFCKQKCKYCSFISFPCVDKINTYIPALLKEIDTRYKQEEIKTLYFGGGTPSLVEIKFLREIVGKFNLDKDCEVTLEMNPDDANFEYLKELNNIGINRLSLGSQTFDNNTLKLIGRRHDSEQIIKAVETAKKAGFENISLDLIYGLPNQTPESLQSDLKKLISLGIQHVSTYGLKIEEESFWGKFPPENIPDDDTQADMYIAINNYLENNGYKRYEISNFALDGFESKHNLNYWENNEYYGFGIAAHGYTNGIRYSNFCTLNEYIENPTKHEYEQVLTPKDMLEEEIFLGFRKESGINLNKIQEKFGIDFEEKYKNILERFTPEHIQKTPTGYKLTLEGVLLSNNILSEFI